MDEIREAALPYRTKCTYDDYAKLPEGSPYQLIGGELVLSPSPTADHQIISIKLEHRMMGFLEENDLGILIHAPMDVYFNQKESYQPDIIFIAGERMEINENTRINGAPDMVVEILSPSTAKDDLTTKFKTYEQYGVKEYWVIDPKDKSVKVYLWHDGKLTLNQQLDVHGLIKSKVLSGFAVDADYLFRRR